ncbi:MAG: hypothetical protein MN733_33880 [Nitrososphaera sp.]|nr:hypothetical protein [Nitrososphaera sp.]
MIFRLRRQGQVLTLAIIAILMVSMGLVNYKALGQSSQALNIGSQTSVFTLTGSEGGATDGSSPQGNDTGPLEPVLAEAIVGSNDSAFVVPAILVELDADSSSSAAVSVQELRVYSPTDERPFAFLDDQFGASYAGNDRSRIFVTPELVELAAPPGGAVGIVLGIEGGSRGDQVKVTFIYLANEGSDLESEILPISTFPFEVIGNFESLERTGDASNASYVSIDNSFVDPEIHCEICTRVEHEPGPLGHAGVTYVTNGTDLDAAKGITFWAMGDGEVIFNVAGIRNPGNDTVSYAESLEVVLGEEWKKFDVDLSGHDLNRVTHLFGFNMTGSEQQIFYIKGITYY